MGDLEGYKLSERREMPVNMETSAAFSSRAIQWWKKVVQRQISLCSRNPQEAEEVDNEPREILVTAHGGVIVTLTQSLIGSRKVVCEEGVKVGKCLNASISVIELDSTGKGTLLKYADVAHLENNPVEVNVDVIGLSTT